MILKHILLGLGLFWYSMVACFALLGVVFLLLIGVEVFIL